MASQARQLSNHYEVLGLSPTASQDEIGGAFERALGNFARPLSATLHIYQAFEVLRQPEKRRAYDRSIGISSEPRQAQFLIPSKARAPFSVAARAAVAEQTAMAAANDPQEKAVLVPEIEAHAEPSPVENFDPAFETADMARFGSPYGSEPERRDEALDDLVGSILAEGHAEKAALHDAERSPYNRRRIGIVAGALVVGAAVLGGAFGLFSSGSGPTDKIVDVPLPAPSPYLAGTAPSQNLGLGDDAAADSEDQGAAESASARKINPLVIPPEVEAAVAERANGTPAVTAPSESEAAAAIVDPLAPEPAVPAPEPAAATAAEAANLPLPKATIARTIERIGYPCGSVSSITTVGGVSKVTCSTGHSYRAAPVGGRYRFKKWSGA